MNSPRNRVLLELHVPDFGPVKEYYGKLGFEVMHETRAVEKEGYLVLEMQENILCFWAGNEYVFEHSYFRHFPKNTKRGYGVEIIIMVDHLDEFYERVKEMVKIVKPLGTRPWGLKDFRIEDPFGYYLRITSIYNVLGHPKTVHKAD